MISIITVVKNGVSSIEQTILSVINQDYPNFEYIIIDGVSTDGTLDILNKYADRISQIISEQDDGIYNAMNKGISHAKGDWVYFLGCDDIFHDKTTLSKIYLNHEYAHYDVIYGNVLFFKSNKVFDGKYDYDKHALKSICQQAIFYRRELFKKFGYFNTDYLTAADYVFNMNVFCYDITKWLYVDIIVADYNETGASSNIYDKKYQDQCFSIRYDNFRLFASKFVLSRIFYSSFLKHFLNNNFKSSLKYLFQVINDVGIIVLFENIYNIIKHKLLK